MNLTAWIVSLVSPLVSRVLISLGFGIVSYVGLSALLDQFILAITENIASMNGVIVSLLSISGFINAIGIMLGAMVAKLALIPLKRLQAMT